LRQGNAALNTLYKEGRKLWAEVINEQSHLEKGKEQEKEKVEKEGVTDRAASLGRRIEDQ